MIQKVATYCITSLALHDVDRLWQVYPSSSSTGVYIPHGILCNFQDNHCSSIHRQTQNQTYSFKLFRINNPQYFPLALIANLPPIICISLGQMNNFSLRQSVVKLHIFYVCNFHRRLFVAGPRARQWWISAADAQERAIFNA